MLTAGSEKIPRFFRLTLQNTRWGYVLAAGLAAWLLVFGADAAQKEDESQYVHLGLISFSPKYILAKDFSHIIFNIKNNGARTLSEIFGWVYLYQEGDAEKAKDFILVNNPHRGGTVVKGNPHRPGTIAQWRFPLTVKNRAITPKDKFTLRVDPKGIFFARMEPPADTAKKADKK